MIVIVQPEVPAYRVPFFAVLSEYLGDRLVVFASSVDSAQSGRDTPPAWFRPLGPILRLPLGLEWQVRALTVPLRREDTLVLWGTARGLTCLALLVRARLIGARVIWWGHLWSATSSAWRAALRLGIMRLASGVLFYTDEEIDLLKQRLPGWDGPVFALNNGIDVKPVSALCGHYDLTARPRDLFFVGRLTTKTGLDLALEALAKPGLEAVTLDIVGGGKDEARLQALARERGVDRRIVWHGGISNEAEIAAVANRCKLFIYPGQVGLSLIHGLAYGLPAIVHDNRWLQMPEYAAFRDGENGKAFKYADIDDLANVVLELLADSDRLKRLSSEARASVADVYNTDAMAKRFLQMTEKLDTY